MIMKQAKYNSRKSFRLSATEDIPIRRRNLSLGSNPQSQPHETSLSPNRVNHIAQALYSSRKNRTILKSSKLKITKFMTQNTRLCQENIVQYNKLKQKVKQNSKMTNNNDYSPPKLQYSPKLSIKNLRMSVNNQSILKNRSYLQRKHLKTEIDKQLPIKKTYRDQLIPIKIPISIKKHSERYSMLTTKKYNQLTLREIAEVDQGPKFNILMKLRQLKNKEISKRQSRKPSEDYSLEGW